LLGSYDSDTYVYASGDGNDLIRDIGNSWDTDVLKLVNVNASGIAVGRSIADPNDFLIDITATGEVITIDDYLLGKPTGIEQIQFADGTSWDRSQIEAVAWIQGTSGADTITGTGGDDKILGKGGDDTLLGAMAATPTATPWATATTSSTTSAIPGTSTSSSSST